MCDIVTVSVSDDPSEFRPSPKDITGMTGLGYHTLSTKDVRACLQDCPSSELLSMFGIPELSCSFENRQNMNPICMVRTCVMLINGRRAQD